MNDRERIHQLLDIVPDNKIAYITGYMQGLMISENMLSKESSSSLTRIQENDEAAEYTNMENIVYEEYPGLRETKGYYKTCVCLNDEERKEFDEDWKMYIQYLLSDEYEEYVSFNEFFDMFALYDIHFYNREYMKELKREREDWKNKKFILRDYSFDSELELKVYIMLKDKMKDTVRIDFHVHLNEIFKVDSKDKEYYHKLWGCHVDIVLRGKWKFANIYCAIEIDGHESHKNDERKRNNDRFKDKIFAENNIPLIRVDKELYPEFDPEREETYPQILIEILKNIRATVDYKRDDYNERKRKEQKDALVTEEVDN